MRAAWIAMSLALLPVEAAAQRPRDMEISASDRAAIVGGVAAAVETYHFDAQTGAAVAAELRRKLSAGDYNGAASALALHRLLNATLDGFDDEHLNVGYSAQPSPLGFAPPPTVEDVASEREAERAEGYGIQRVERLAGNVGLLKLNRFPHPEAASEALVAAMRLLDGTDALILDLRDNTGGDGDTVAFLISWFVGPDPIHLSDSISRAGLRQFWSAEWMPVRRYSAPVYVLTSARTYSGGEGLAYGLQALGRAQVVGEQTRGGAHPARWYTVHPQFAVQIPWARVVNTRTNQDWESRGVAPDIAVSAQSALVVAHRRLVQSLIDAAPEGERAALRRVLDGIED